MFIEFSVGIFTLLGIGLVLCGLIAVIALWAYRRGRRSNPMWTTVLQRLPLGVALFSAGGRRVFANPTADEALAQLDAAAVEQAQRAALSGTSQSTSTVVRGANGLTAQLQATRLHEHEVAVLLTLRDLTQQQLSEAGYRKLIHTLSHELLTPLTAIGGHLAHISASTNGARDETVWIGSLRVARDEVDRMTRLTSNLLILSRLESGQPLQRRPTNMEALAEEVVLQFLERAEARRVRLSINAAPALPRPNVDRDAWKQVLLNLADNAIKYGRECGRVDVDLTVEKGAMIIGVVDDGPGIPSEDVPHIFDEFFRSDAHRQTQVGGSGLGLAIVKRIVERHGARIICESIVGQGTTFRITLTLDNTGIGTSPDPRSDVTEA